MNDKSLEQIIADLKQNIADIEIRVALLENRLIFLGLDRIKPTKGK